MSEYTSDVAIVMLNHYPPAIARRAIESIRGQATFRRWTLYLGFHDRAASHREAMRQACAALPVHFVTIERDYVFDARARDVVLQEALARGRHQFLFFLDDDDEWYADYLETMTALGAPFATCAKDVADSEAGEVTTVQDDIDFEGMGFQMAAWGTRRLPFFAKQATDKYLCREFNRRYGPHPHVARPLYRVHRHRDSLTFRKVLGRRDEAAADPIEFVVVTRRPGARDSTASAIAGALATRPLALGEIPRHGGDRSRVLLVPLALVPACRDRVGRSTSGSRDLVVGIATAPVEGIAERPPDVRRRWLDSIAQAHAILLCEPLWAEAYEKIGATVFPIGLPSLVEEDRIRARAGAARAGTRVARVSIAAGRRPTRATLNSIAAVTALLGDVQVTASLPHADVCWCPDAGPHDWGARVLRCYEAGVPCLASNRTSAAQMLADMRDPPSRPDDPEATAMRIRRFEPDAGRADLVATLPFFRRCFSPFYWRNSLEAHCRSRLNGGSA